MCLVKAKFSERKLVRCTVDLLYVYHVSGLKVPMK